MKSLFAYMFLAISFFSFAQSQELPKPWYQTNLEEYSSGVLNDPNEQYSIGFLKSKHTDSSSSRVLQHASPTSEWLGKKIKLTARIKTVDADSATMFMIVKHNNREKTYDDMVNREIKGTTDIEEYSIVLELKDEPAQDLLFGVTLKGQGEVYFEKFEFSEVSYDTPVTGSLEIIQQRATPENLDFRIY